MKSESKFAAMVAAARVGHIHRLVVLVSNFIGKSAGEVVLALAQSGKSVVATVTASTIVLVCGGKKITISKK